MSSHRIASNTITTYLRTILAVTLALFSSRWVLNALGQTDYGLYSVVGSVIVFITFLNGVMAFSVSRHFAYCIGQGDLSELKSWFNGAVGIHLVVAVLLLGIGWPIGEYVVGNILTVPSGRLVASIWVFRLSLISAFVSMVSVPYIAMFTARQRLAEPATWGMLQSLLSFSLAWSMRRASGDMLIYYAAGMVAIIVLVNSILVVRAKLIFRECVVEGRGWFDRRKFKAIFSYAGWNLFGSLGVLFRDQGSALLLNLFFGPAVNAAYGIAGQVSMQTNQLSNALVGAFSPEITACEGRGDRERMLALSQQASKYGTLLVLLFAIPLMIEMKYVLKLWLGTPPPLTALFCQLMLATFIIDRLSSGYMLAVQAHGKIAAYQATVGASLLLTLPLAWLLLKSGFAPTSIGLAFIATMTVTSLGRVAWGRYLFGMPVSGWGLQVLLPGTVVALVATLAALAPHLLLPPMFLRLVLVSVSSAAATLLAVWWVALDCRERNSARAGFRRSLSRLGRLPRS